MQTPQNSDEYEKPLQSSGMSVGVNVRKVKDDDSLQPGALGDESEDSQSVFSSESSSTSSILNGIPAFVCPACSYRLSKAQLRELRERGNCIAPSVSSSPRSEGGDSRTRPSSFENEPFEPLDLLLPSHSDSAEEPHEALAHSPTDTKPDPFRNLVSILSRIQGTNGDAIGSMALENLVEDFGVTFVEDLLKLESVTFEGESMRFPSLSEEAAAYELVSLVLKATLQRTLACVFPSATGPPSAVGVGCGAELRELGVQCAPGVCAAGTQAGLTYKELEFAPDDPRLVPCGLLEIYRDRLIGAFTADGSGAMREVANIFLSVDTTALAAARGARPPTTDAAVGARPLPWEDEDFKAKFSAARAKAHHFWKLLKTPNSDIISFLITVETKFSTRGPEEALAFYTHELRVLEFHQDIAQALARREKLNASVKRCVQAAMDPASLFDTTPKHFHNLEVFKNIAIYEILELDRDILAKFGEFEELAGRPFVLSGVECAPVFARTAEAFRAWANGLGRAAY
eukprot:gnl/Chilomastix_cuspidata/4797.p1 GENE.gnl/Chilomastix_cuspidata/4797~~gnl/Chilomastix_cuspidata/4797.p1  ORF type:complete len:528 (+),score=188.02 gnl/Chilomastix_cuspidata/4797:40-1584(+)